MAEEAVETETTSRSQMYKHEDAAAWLTEQGLIDADSTQGEVIAAFAANRNAYRRTDRYRALVEAGDPSKAEQAAAKEAAKAEKEAAKAVKAQEREEAKAAKAAVKEAEKATKAAAAAAATTPAEPVKATKATKKAAKATAGTEDPFA